MKSTQIKRIIVNDSRFGIRELPQTKNEISHVFTYPSPGRGPNGEHQN